MISNIFRGCRRQLPRAFSAAPAESGKTTPIHLQPFDGAKYMQVSNKLKVPRDSTRPPLGTPSSMSTHSPEPRS